ncbi:MAG: rhodanese-like domain-containing protein [Myxococcota bacterium]|nr:rhodanese-like domain-containing protein [Myxococcota bacterium]
MLWLLLACTEAPQDTQDSGVQALERVQDLDFLSQVVGDPGYQIVDVRSPEEFAAGHVPGALNLYWEDLRGETDGLTGMVADSATVTAAAQAGGLRTDAVPVVYGGRGGRDAGRFVWTLDHYGDDRALVVDGGWIAWDLEGLEQEAGAWSGDPGDWSAAGPVDRVLAESDWIRDNLDNPDVVVLDVRAPDEYAAGHIPGALNVEWSENVDLDTGLWLPDSELQALYADIDKDATVVVTCRSGARAGMGYVVLPHLGFSDVRLHDGSWKQWEAGDYPVE